jgi:glycosyltransferase involved in cell wall biosynthesis
MSKFLSYPKRKITFVLPFVNLTGGIKILFEHANQLAERGHQITILYPGVLFHDNNFSITNSSWRWQLIEVPLRSLKYWLFVSLLKKTDAHWFRLHSKIRLKRTPDLSARFAPSADIVIATAPETVPWVATYPTSKGIKVHFSQDYEVWYLPESFLDRVLSENMMMHLLTIGSWQRELYQTRHHRTVEAVIPNGIDTRHYTAKRKRYLEASDRPLRVLMNYHHAAYKGMADGLAAIEIVRQAGYQIQTVLFGLHPLKGDMPKDIEYHQNIAEADLPDLYRSCDVFLWPTHREGFGLPPMEAMACGTPVVATATGAVPDYVDDGKTGFIIPIQQPDELAKKLISLAANPKLRQTMGQAAAKAMKAWSWEKQTDRLEQYLLSLNKSLNKEAS